MRKTTSKQESKKNKWKKFRDLERQGGDQGADQEEERRSVEKFWQVKNQSSFYHQVRGFRLDYVS